jgi:hypothetical protein
MRFLRKRKGADASALGNSANRVTAFTMKPMAIQLQEDVISRRRSMTGPPEAADGLYGGRLSVAAAEAKSNVL